MFEITFKETRVYQEIELEGRLMEAQSLILRLLTRRVGELPQDVRTRVETLSLEQLENLGEALLDFSSMADLQVWLQALGE
jgi:predicted transposase YdaD